MSAYDEIVAMRSVLDSTASLLRSPTGEVSARVEQLLDKLGGMERELSDWASRRRVETVAELAAAAVGIGDASLVVSASAGDGIELRQVALAVRDRLRGPSVVILGSSEAGKASLVGLLTSDLVEKGLSASELIAHAARELGGGGSSDPELAQAGGPNGARLQQALELAMREAEGALAAL